MCALDVMFEMRVAQEVFGTSSLGTFENSSICMRAQVLMEAGLAIEGFGTAIIRAAKALQGGGSRSAKGRRGRCRCCSQGFVGRVVIAVRVGQRQMSEVLAIFGEHAHGRRISAGH
jgi:hypothetical protein